MEVLNQYLGKVSLLQLLPEYMSIAQSSKILIL